MDWKQAEWASKTRWHSGLAKKNYWQINQQTLWQNALAECIGSSPNGLAKHIETGD
jgi:hypothetical protein